MKILRSKIIRHWNNKHTHTHTHTHTHNIARCKHGSSFSPILFGIYIYTGICICVRAFGVDVAMNRWWSSVIGTIKINGPNVIKISLCWRSRMCWWVGTNAANNILINLKKQWMYLFFWVIPTDCICSINVNLSILRLIQRYTWLYIHLFYTFTMTCFGR